MKWPNGVGASRVRTQRRSTSSVTRQASGTNLSHGAAAKRGSSHPAPSAATSASIAGRRSSGTMSSKHWPSSGTKASRYTSRPIRSGSRSATPVITIPPELLPTGPAF